MCFLAGQCLKDHRVHLTDGCGLGVRRIHRIALGEIHRYGNNEHHVVLHVFRNLRVGVSVDIHLHKTGLSADFIRIGYDTIDLIGNVKGPWGLDRFRIHLALEKELAAILRRMPGHRAVFLGALLICGHV